MSTFLLILNTIMNIFIIINILNIKPSINKLTNYKKTRVNKFKEAINNYYNNNSSDDFYDDMFEDVTYYDDHTTNKIVEDLYTPLEIRDEEKIIQSNRYGVFRNVYDFIDYVSGHNTEIVDVTNKKIRKIKYLEKCICNNQENVIITFDDGKEVPFKPYVYARAF